MKIIREKFTESYWFGLSTFEQLVYIGFDVEMAIDLRKNGDKKECNAAIDRALELLELSIIDPQNVKRLRELNGIKIALLDDFRGNNECQSTDEAWHKYFACFRHLVNANKEDNSGTNKCGATAQ